MKEDHALLNEINQLAEDLPNLNSSKTPVGEEPRYVVFVLQLKTYPSVEVLTPEPSTALCDIFTSHYWKPCRVVTARGMIMFT